jgi:hypothetical protein
MNYAYRLKPKTKARASRNGLTEYIPYNDPRSNKYEDDPETTERIYDLSMTDSEEELPME